MTDNPLITVLLPCYNAQDYLSDALISIVNQTYENLEILCINDGSTDDTAKILEEFAKRDSRICVVHNVENLKLIQTLNKGISLAQGEYIARMDADDISLPERFEKQFEFLSSKDYDIISCFSDLILNDRIVKGNRFEFTDFPYINFYLHLVNPLVHTGILAKTSVLKQNSYSTEQKALHNEDYQLWSQLALNQKIGIIPEVLVHYRMHAESVSAQNNALQQVNFSHNLQTYWKFNHLSIGYEVSNLITHNHLKKVAVKDFQECNTAFDSLIDFYMKAFPTIKEYALRQIVKRHIYRMHWQLFKGKSTIAFKLFLFLKLGFSLRQHYLSRKLF